MRGWVYIITNKAMPGLLKVGFSLKDPHLRAKELGHTGAPHPYVVAFDMLVNEPRNIEQKIHSALSEKREGKEWFRCEIHEALEVIHAVSGTEVLLHGTKVPPEPQVAGQGATGSKDVGTSAAVKTGKYSRTATYSGKCSHCGEQFTVTLTRYDSGARCPSCFRRNDTSHFELREFVI